VGKLQENNNNNIKKSFSETPKPNSMGYYQEEAQSWKEVLEGKFEFELMY
jgi:hypothetical protein